MYRKFTENSTCFTLRIHNADTLSIINELAKKRGGNRNAVINDLLDVGASIERSKALEEKVKPQPYEPSVGRELKEIRLDIDDLYVMLNIIESLIAGIFNAKMDELSGEPVNAEALRMGIYSDLPEFLQSVKREILNRHAPRKR